MQWITKIEVKWALIFSLTSIIWMYVEKSMGWHGEHIDQHPTMTNLFTIIMITIYLFALLEKRKSLGGFITWKQAFISGLTIAILVTILSPTTQWYTHSCFSRILSKCHRVRCYPKKYEPRTNAGLLQS